MENSGYVIKVERALSIVSVQFWSTFPQKVNSFDVDVNWFYPGPGQDENLPPVTVRNQKTY